MNSIKQLHLVSITAKKVGKDSYLLYVMSDLVDVVRLAYQGIDLFEIRLFFQYQR
ncbi:MAG: hypothetical protein QN732_11120 [Nitrososphaeraceae archaeon]|nr:hypothetical protein [Nitrososphaeraceae archaeon]